jgi:hypothetical protein
MTRTAFILSIGLLSFGAAACGDYDEKNAAYDQNNAAAYDEEGNAAYDETGNAAYAPPEGNAAYVPPADANVSTNNTVGEVPPPPPPTTNGY